MNKGSRGYSSNQATGQPYKADRPNLQDLVDFFTASPTTSSKMATIPPASPDQSEDFIIPEIPKEERIRLALQRFESQGGKEGPESITAIAKKFNIHKNTLLGRINGSVSRQQQNEMMQKLGKYEEQAIEEWITQLQAWNWPPRVEKVRLIANELLRAKGIKEPIGINWASRFLSRHTGLKTTYIPPLDKSRVDAQDPAVLSDWFRLFWTLKIEHNIDDANIWNMDEKGFMQGVIGKLRVMISKYETKAHMSQPGNREWVSIIECISATGRKLKPWIIFKGTLQQRAWWKELEEGHICLSENGYTDNELGLAWFTEAFHPETKPKHEQGQQWRMLIVDGHTSHITTEVIRFCIAQKIILLCLPAHTTHILQPLDIGVFSPLANAYKKQVHSNSAYGAAASIEKSEFIRFFKMARNEAITPTNIQKAWAKAGLFPYAPEPIIQKFLPAPAPASVPENPADQVTWNITFRPTTPPETTISYSNPYTHTTFQEVVTPGNIQEVRAITKQFQNNKDLPIAQKEYMQKVANAAEKFMASTQIHSALNTEFYELQKRKKEKANRSRGNYGAARVMNETALQERQQWQKEQDAKNRQREWIKQVKLLGRIDPYIFTPRAPSTPKKKAPITPKTTPGAGARSVQFRLPQAGSPQAAPQVTPRARARKKRLIVTLYTRVSTRALEQGKQGQQGQQQQQQQQQHQDLSATYQTGRRLRIRKASTRVQ